MSRTVPRNPSPSSPTRMTSGRTYTRTAAPSAGARPTGVADTFLPATTQVPPPAAVPSRALTSPMNWATKSVAGRRYTSWGRSSWWMTPSAMTAIRSETARASSWSWVTRMVVVPILRCSEETSSRRRTRSWASRLENGSSSRSRSGWMTRALASAARCCWPPDSWRGCRSAMPSRPTSSSTSATCFPRRAAVTLRMRRPNATLSATVMCGNRA